MNFRTLLQSLIYVWSFTLSRAFFPNLFGEYVNSKDYTHAEITEIGILQAVAEYFEQTPAVPGGSSPGPGALTGIVDITARKLFYKYYGDTRSEKRFQEAIDQIVRYNNKVDQDHYFEAAWHFNGEQIAESHKKMQDIRDSILNELQKSQPNYEYAREMIGQFLHILQMFYSNTNWIEGHGANIYPILGMTGGTLFHIPTSSEDTCKSCRAPCIFNIMNVTTTITSGYKGGQDIQKPYKDPTSSTGKCSHGGPTDNTTSTIGATGGINKDSSNVTVAPHFYKHNDAATAAIEHTKYFFTDASSGLRKEIGSEKFLDLLQIRPRHSVVFVIDVSASMQTELPLIIQHATSIIQTASGGSPENFILVTFSDPGTSTTVKNTTQSNDIISWISAIQLQGGDDCPEFSLTGIEEAANVASPDSVLYVFTDSPPKDPYKQDKIESTVATKRLRVYFIVTGTCSTTNQQGLKYSDNLNHGLGRRKRETIHEENTHSHETTKHVLILKRELNVLESTYIAIPVDNTLYELQIDIQGDTAMPYPVVQKPNKEYLNIDGNLISETRFEDNMASFKIKDPLPGIWSLYLSDKSKWKVKVTGQSTIDFEYSLLSQIYGMHESVIVKVEVEGRNDISMKNLVVGNIAGDELDKVSLNMVYKGDNGNQYECKLTTFRNDYVFGIEGLDGDGNEFQRLYHSQRFDNTLSQNKVASRHIRSTTTWDLIDVYRHIATVSGGHVFQTTQDQIPNIATILKSSIASVEVLILKGIYTGGPSSPKEIQIPVDSSITQFTLKMHGKQEMPRFILKDGKNAVHQIDNKTVTLYSIGTTYLSVVVEKPEAGSWIVRKNDFDEWDVEVTAKSTLDFSAKFMKYDPAGFCFFEVPGRPIPDDNVTLSIEVNDASVIHDLTYVSLLDVYGDEIAHYSLKRKESRNARAFFVTTIIIPHESFKLAVIGTDSPNQEPFIRIHRDVIETVNIKLDHIPEKVPLYMNEDLNLTFVVTNAGSQDEDVKVTIKDDKNFVFGAFSRTFHLKAWSNQTGFFTLHGGPTKGEITTITLTATPAVSSGTDTQFQKIITYLTVEERKLDTIPPVCNVTSQPVSCGQDPCICQQINAYMTAEIWDEGDGLANITAQNTPVNALRLNGFTVGLVKAVGVVIATLTVDCCRNNVTIDVLDRKNLTGSCVIPVNPSYDINACTTTTPSTTTLSTTISSTTVSTTTLDTTSSTPVTTTTTTPTATSTTPVSTSTTTPAATSTTPVSMSTTPAATSSTPVSMSTTPAATSTTPAATSTPVATSTTPAATSTTLAATSTTSASMTLTSTTSTTINNKAMPSSSTLISTATGTTVSPLSSVASVSVSGVTQSPTSTPSSVSTITAGAAQTKTTAQNPTASKEGNSSTLSDGAVYGIAAGVGAVTLACVIGGVLIIMKKMSQVAPKNTTEDPN